MGGAIQKIEKQRKSLVTETKEDVIVKSETKNGLMCFNTVTDCYELNELIGEGSFAQVFLAKAYEEYLPTYRTKSKKVMPQTVAMKRIEKNDTVKHQDVMKEMALLKEIDSDLIVKHFDDFENDEFYFIVLECVSGGELFDYVIEKNSLNEKEAAIITAQVARALAFMHDHCIVHRDIKPENILFVKNSFPPQIKLTDLGLAEKISSPNGEHLTSSCGTPGYVAPEILHQLPYGAKVDVWSLGVILYIILCGYPPFYSTDQSQLFRQIKRAEYDFNDEYWQTVSPEVKDLISQVLVVNSKDRLSAKEFLQKPWIIDAADQSEVNLGKHVVEGIHEVKQDFRLKKVAVAINVVSAFQKQLTQKRIMDKIKARRDSLTLVKK